MSEQLVLAMGELDLQEGPGVKTSLIMKSEKGTMMENSLQN